MVGLYLGQNPLLHSGKLISYVDIKLVVAFPFFWEMASSKSWHAPSMVTVKSSEKSVLL